METKDLLKKEKSHAFGKDVYLFAKDKNGVNYWLEAPRWDCGWYWGFGYIETYKRNSKPHNALDIDSHEHFDGLTGQQNEYDFKKGCFVNTEYVHNVWDNKRFSGFTFDEKTGWKISELFKQFYLLRDMAGFCQRKPSPGCHITTVQEVNHGDLTEWYNKINKEMIPAVTAQILAYLTPEK